MHLKPNMSNTRDRFLQLVFDFLAPQGQAQSKPGLTPFSSSSTTSAGFLADVNIANAGHDSSDAHHQAKGPGSKLKTESKIEPEPVLGPSLGASPGWISHPHATHRLSLNGANFDYALVRSKRKTIALLVTPRGLEVRAPRWVNMSQIKEAIQERETWIFKQFDFMRQKRQEAKQGEIEIRDGCVSCILGHQVQWVFAWMDKATVKPEEEGVTQTLSPVQLSSLKRINAKQSKTPLAHLEVAYLQEGVWHPVNFEDWVEHLMCTEPLEVCSYRVYLPIGELFSGLETLEALEVTELEGLEVKSSASLSLGAHKRCAKAWMDTVHMAVLDSVAKQRVAHFAVLLGVKPTALSYGHAKQRWGSAGSNGAIRLNGHLVHVPLALLDYVVAHELSHLRHMNHGPAFWALVAQVMPDFALRKAQLKKVLMPQWV